MDLCAEMLVKYWPTEAGSGGQPEQIRPRFHRLPFPLRWFFGQRRLFNAERLFNRFCIYPRHVNSLRDGPGAFHICDHSYAHLIHQLPAERTGVYCHDLDAFRSVLDPAAESRPAWFRAMARRILTGLQRAAVVFYNSHEIGRQLRESRLIDENRLVHAPLGVAEEYQRGETHDATAELLLSKFNGQRFLLHVGSCIPRKRVDVLIDVVAELKARQVPVKLLQVGGEWTSSHSEQIRSHGLTSDIVQTSRLSRSTLAALCQRAALVLIPSEAEGFGLPAIEALACGSVLLASDIPVLREVAGDAATFCPVGDAHAFAAAAYRLLADPTAAPTLSARLEQAGQYCWRTHAQTIAEAYARLL